MVWIIRPHGANPAGGSFYSLSCPSRGSLYTPLLFLSSLLVFITIVILFLWLSISHFTVSSRLLFLSTPWSLWFCLLCLSFLWNPFPFSWFLLCPSWIPFLLISFQTFLPNVEFYWPLIWLFCLPCFFQTRISFNRRKKKCILFQESEGNIFNLGSVGSTDAKTPDSKNESDVEKSIQDGVVGDHHHHHRHNNAKDSLPPGLSSCSLPLAPFHPFYRSPVWTKIKCQFSPSMIIMIITVSLGCLWMALIKRSNSSCQG